MSSNLGAEIVGSIDEDFEHAQSASPVVKYRDEDLEADLAGDQKRSEAGKSFQISSPI